MKYFEGIQKAYLLGVTYRTSLDLSANNQAHLNIVNEEPYDLDRGECVRVLGRAQSKAAGERRDMMADFNNLGRLEKLVFWIGKVRGK